MSWQMVSLQKFIESLVIKSTTFPKADLETYSKQGCFQPPQISAYYSKEKKLSEQQAKNLKHLLFTLYLSAIKKPNLLLKEAFDLITQLLKGRLLIFEGNVANHFCDLHQVMAIMVPIALQSGKQDLLTNCLQQVNKSSTNLLHPITLAAEVLFISHISSLLTKNSLQEFQQMLKSIMPASKLIYTRQNISKLLKLQDLLLYRENEEDKLISTFQVELSGLEICDSKTQLPRWVSEAYDQSPRPVQPNVYSGLSVYEFYMFLGYLQVYASSPKVQVLNELISDQELLQLFVKFLTGAKMAEDEYRFKLQELRTEMMNWNRRMELYPIYEKLFVNQVMRRYLK